MKNKFRFNTLYFIKQRGIGMIELMLALVVMMAGVIGVYVMLKPASIKAGVEKEQGQLVTLAQGIEGAFGATQGNYAGLSNTSAKDLRMSGVDFNGTGLSSALGDNMVLRPATVRVANDAFDVVYQGLNTKKCIAYVNAFYPQTYAIVAGTNTQLQQTNGSSEGRIVSEEVLVNTCNSTAFKQNTGQLVFRFFKPSARSATATAEVCGCTPRTQTRDLNCSSGQIGNIAQTRSSTCTGGTAACPTEVWSSWTTTNNSCAGASLGQGGAAAVAPANNGCNAGTESQVLTCPVGQTGGITQERTSTCSSPTAVPTWTAWTTVRNTCASDTDETFSCTPSVQTRNVACPSPQIGSIVEQRSSTCSGPRAAPTWGAWSETSQNCAIACVAGQNCCQPLQDETRNVNCSTGYYGQTQERRNSFCPAVDSPVNWTSWYYESGSCTACPADVTERETQWVVVNGGCPSGYTGSNTYEQEQERTRTRYYACPAGTLTLPPVAWTAWTGWSNTANTRNASNTCAPSGCTIPAGTSQTWTVGGNTCNHTLGAAVTVGSGSSATWTDSVNPTTGSASYACTNGVVSSTPDAGATCNMAACVGLTAQTQWVAASAACPVGQTGSNTWEKEQVQNRTCSSPPTWDAWGTWIDTGNTRNVVNTCTPSACSGPNSQTQWVPSSAACPAGYTGSNTWESEQIQTRTCSSPPTWDAWGPWSNTGNTRNVVNTCAPSGCTIPAGTARTWTVGANTCTSTQGAAVTIAHGASNSWTDSGAPTTGTAGFACNNGTLSGTPNAGATCDAPSSCPAQPAPTTRTLTCESVHGGTAANWTGSITQTNNWANAAAPTCWTQSWATTSDTCTSVPVINSCTNRDPVYDNGGPESSCVGRNYGNYEWTGPDGVHKILEWDEYGFGWRGRNLDNNAILCTNAWNAGSPGSCGTLYNEATNGPWRDATDWKQYTCSLGTLQDIEERVNC